MNLTTLAHRLWRTTFWRTTRRRRSTGLAVESIEMRLALSITLPVQPLHVPSLVAAPSPLEGRLVESIQWSGTVRGTFHEHDVSSPPLFAFTARGTLSPGGKSTVTGSLSEIHGGWSGAMAITTRHGKIMANLSSLPELDVPVESLHYIERGGTGQYAHATAEGDADFAMVERPGKGAPHGTITIHFLPASEG